MKKFNLVAMIGLFAVLWSAMLITSAQEGEMTTDLPAPAAEMNQLDWFIGEWDIKSRMLMNAEADEWLEEDLRSTHTYEMGGHIVFEHFFGPLGGEPFEAWSIRKYNSQNSTWQQRWFDTSSPGVAEWQGTMQEDGTFIGYAKRFLDTDGNIAGDEAVREVFDNITPDQFSWRYEATSDGGQTWQVQWTLEYVRRK